MKLIMTGMRTIRIQRFHPRLELIDLQLDPTRRPAGKLQRGRCPQLRL